MRLSLILKGLGVIVALVALSTTRSYPPTMRAEEPPPRIEVTEPMHTEIALNTQSIKEINDHLIATDAVVRKNFEDEKTLREMDRKDLDQVIRDAAAQQAHSSDYFALITFIITGSGFFQWWTIKKGK